MLKARFLATTFFIAVSSICFAPAHARADQPGIGVAADTFQFHAPPKNRNRKFLCTYGYKVYFDVNSGSGSSYYVWTKFAAPITGKGASVSKIEVADAAYSGAGQFIVGIHKDQKGEPGDLITSGRGIARGSPSGSCFLTTVAIPKIFLTAGVRYWVVERATHGPHREHAPRYYRDAVEWGYTSNAKHNALYQSYYSLGGGGGGGGGSLTDWLPVTGQAPFVKVK